MRAVGLDTDGFVNIDKLPRFESLIEEYRQFRSDFWSLVVKLSKEAVNRKTPTVCNNYLLRPVDGTKFNGECTNLVNEWTQHPQLCRSKKDPRCNNLLKVVKLEHQKLTESAEKCSGF
jgi:hypothetical protein